MGLGKRPREPCVQQYSVKRGNNLTSIIFFEIMPASIVSLPTDRLYYVAGILVIIVGAAFVGHDIGLYPKTQSSEAIALPTDHQRNFARTGELPDIPKLEDHISKHIMGQPAGTALGISTELLPETTLNIELIGTFTSDAERSSAVIAVESSGSNRFYPKEEIQDGVILHSIREAEVIISRGSVLEVLRLHEPVKHTDPSRYQRGRKSQATRYSLNER
ncbi:type II secretion system protein N [Parahaliea aestuarii]|uniref:Type II secretion system protein GspC N-terminal domain-containing protein n=1 Tax=Parahaliea aestuarii TaxID=1852021 RepID=A0A5C8ZKG0_9GAMM|nr:type II secretion system protein N [Parahaliea aestuarii]TXS89036.1 hypothetical protein FVW59_19110 [Parahaliea aestuarii]